MEDKRMTDFKIDRVTLNVLLWMDISAHNEGRNINNHTRSNIRIRMERIHRKEAYQLHYTQIVKEMSF